MGKSIRRPKAPEGIRVLLHGEKYSASFRKANNLEECYNILYTQSYNDNNAIIILSPASPSYDMFKNFEERGNKFKELINKQK